MLEEIYGQYHVTTNENMQALKPDGSVMERGARYLLLSNGKTVRFSNIVLNSSIAGQEKLYHRV